MITLIVAGAALFLLGMFCGMYLAALLGANGEDDDEF